MTEEQLTALLRLKRYEQPPPEYFERLLREIHRRQRADLVQLPLWRIALERGRVFFGEHGMGHFSSAGALAVALVVGVAVIKPAPLSNAPSLKVFAATPRPAPEATEPRYVIDIRPPTYEPGASISF